MQVDLTKTARDYAIFLPAISSFYVTHLSKQANTGTWITEDRVPKGYENGVEGMNFLNKEQGYFYYPCALYSAGHAQLNLEKAYIDECMIHQRNREDTLIIGDSGGFQIGKGVIKFDWKDFRGDTANALRMKILRWLESTADYSQTLDIPSWATEGRNGERTGLKTFKDCLDGSLYNYEFFAKHRVPKGEPGSTKFLNILQGSTEEDAEEWYRNVKDFEFEGWAFGGGLIVAKDMRYILRRIITLRDEGLLKEGERDWIHILGVGKIDWAVMLTCIQRRLRAHVNSRLVMSCDAASPFLTTAHGEINTFESFSPKRFRYLTQKAPDHFDFVGSDLPVPFRSPLMDRLTMGDLCKFKPGMRNKRGVEIQDTEEKIVCEITGKTEKERSPTSWDTFAYAMMMGHNVFCHIQAVQNANRLFDVELIQHPFKWRSFKTGLKSKDTSQDVSEFVPSELLAFDDFIEELFTCDDPYELIDSKSARTFLSLFRKREDRSNVFGSLFNETTDSVYN